MLTFTPETTGSYAIYASSWYQLFTNQPDPGTDYRVDMWISNPATDVGSTFSATAAEIGTGTTYGNLELAGDRDMYSSRPPPRASFTISLTLAVLPDKKNWTRKRLAKASAFFACTTATATSSQLA